MPFLRESVLFERESVVCWYSCIHATKKKERQDIKKEGQEEQRPTKTWKMILRHAHDARRVHVPHALASRLMLHHLPEVVGLAR